MRWIALVALAVWLNMLVGVPQASAAEQRLARPQFTPITLDQQPPNNGEVTGAVRRASLEKVEAAPEVKQPRPLAPKSASHRQSISRPSAVSPAKTLATVGGSLGLVIGLFLVVSWCLQRGSPQQNQRLPKEAIEVLGQAPLVGRQQMQLMRLGNKLLLLAITPGGGAETLAEISDPEEVEALLAMCRRNQRGSSTASFQQTLNELSQRRSVAPSRGGR